MKIIHQGSTPNPTVRFVCQDCNSILEANMSELYEASVDGKLLGFLCPVCGMSKFVWRNNLMKVPPENHSA